MIAILGATGYTGALVVGYFAREMKHVPYLLAARSPGRLDDVRARAGTPDDVPTVVADVRDRASLRALVQRWGTSRLDPLRQYVRVFASLVAFAENELAA